MGGELQPVNSTVRGSSPGNLLLTVRVPASPWMQDCRTGWSSASWVISAAWQKLLVEAKVVLIVDLILLLFKPAIKLS